MNRKLVVMLLSGGLIFSSASGMSVTVCAAENVSNMETVDSQQETLINLSDINVEVTSENIDGNVYSGELSTGAAFYAYVPNSKNYGTRATSNPILMVYGDTAYTEETAKETAISSGLAQIADKEGAPVIFVNPKGEEWGSEDVDSYLAVRSMFSDSSSSVYDQEGRAEDTTAEDGTVTPGCYPATASRMYVFADGKGADFVYENLAAGVVAPSLYVGETSIWRPAAMFLLNPTSTSAVDLAGIQVENYEYLKQDQSREVPVVIVNGTEEISNTFSQHNSEENTLEIVNSKATTLGMAQEELIEGYNTIMEHWMVHDMGRGVVLQHISSAESLNLIETAEYFESSTGTIKYYQFLPKDIGSFEANSLPLVFGFHGGGSSAENYTWTSGWAEVASENHFMYVAVEQHVNIEPDQIIELLASLEEQYPCIDSRRIYASGFSMGSIKSTACAYEYDNIFAAINPTNAIAFGDYEGTANGNVVPVFYNAGLNSFFNMMESYEVAWGENQQNGIAELLKDNGVILSVEEYQYDPSANAEAGVFSEAGKFDSFALTNVQEDGSLADPWGYKADEIVQIESEIPGITATICYFDSEDGNCYTVLSTSSYAGHEPLKIIAENAWDFMSQFSRNEDGSLTIQK